MAKTCHSIIIAAFANLIYAYMYIYVWAAGRPVLYISLVISLLLWSHHDHYYSQSVEWLSLPIHTIIITMHSLVYIAI